MVQTCHKMDVVEIKNDEGLTAKLLTYGATLASLKFTSSHGNDIDCVLGYDSKEGYLQDEAYMGRTIGRVANRIRDGKFLFKGQQYELPTNCPPHNHHGGPNSTAFHDWEIVRQSVASVTFRTICTEKIDGFPGDAKIDVTYTVNDRNQLLVEHSATCSKEGVLALAHHPYFNLDGSDDVTDHFIQLRADEYLPTDETNCTTGGIHTVKDTNFDLREAQQLGQLKNHEGIIDVDQDFVLSSTEHPGEPTLTLFSEKSGIKMDIATSYPVIHLYGGKFLNCKGRKGENYGPGKGIAIEAQFHTAAVNYDNYPDIALNPDQPYLQEVIYSFSHL